MHEGDRESEDGSREETFVDAPDDLGFSEGRSPIGDPMVLIGVSQSNEVAHLASRLEAALAECTKYKVVLLFDYMRQKILISFSFLGVVVNEVWIDFRKKERHVGGKL